MTYPQNKNPLCLTYMATYYLLVPILFITYYLGYIPIIYYLAYLIN
jgi:hypothetical protein